jgi:hypothetical protein
MFELYWTDEAQRRLSELRQNRGLQKRYKAVVKGIRFLAADPRHPSLQTHEYTSLKGPTGEKVFEAYAEQATSAAYRIFWYYGPKKGQITIIAITPHP